MVVDIRNQKNYSQVKGVDSAGGVISIDQFNSDTSVTFANLPHQAHAFMFAYTVIERFGLPTSGIVGSIFANGLIVKANIDLTAVGLIGSEVIAVNATSGADLRFDINQNAGSGKIAISVVFCEYNKSTGELLNIT